MNFLDIILIVPLLWSAYKGFTKGFIIELSSLAALILGVYLAYNFSGYAQNFLIENFNVGSQYLQIISFALTFIVVVILIIVLAKVLEKFIDILSLGFINKLAGALFGVFKIVFILSILLIIIENFDGNNNLITKKNKKESFLYGYIAPFATKIIPKMKQLIDSSTIDKINKEKDNLIKSI